MSQLKPGWLCPGLNSLARFLATAVLEQDAKPQIVQNGQAIVCKCVNGDQGSHYKQCLDFFFRLSCCFFT